jgi:hypothetical protein
MSSRKVSSIIFVLMLLLGADSCGAFPTISPINSPTGRVGAHTSTRTPIPTSIRTPVPTPASTRAQIQGPSTEPSTPTLSEDIAHTGIEALPQTLSPVPPTETPMPTLSMDLAGARFEELLRTNGNCQLPCWWGIVPGKTSFLDAKKTLIPLSGIFLYNEFGYRFNTGVGSFNMSYPIETNDLLLDVHFSTLSDKNEVFILELSSQVLHHITAGAENVYNDQTYLALMKNYTLQSILSTYGKPEQVVFRMDIIVDNYDLPAYLEMRLLYPDKSIFVKYKMDARLNGDQVVTCPTQSFISLWLIPAGSETRYQQILTSLSTEWEGYFPLNNDVMTMSRSFEEAAHFSIDSFYEQYRVPTNACLVTPRSIWPRP